MRPCLVCADGWASRPDLTVPTLIWQGHVTDVSVVLRTARRAVPTLIWFVCAGWFVVGFFELI
jgi:hypothetical protein